MELFGDSFKLWSFILRIVICNKYKEKAQFLIGLIWLILEVIVNMKTLKKIWIFLSYDIFLKNRK